MCSAAEGVGAMLFCGAADGLLPHRPGAERQLKLHAASSLEWLASDRDESEVCDSENSPAAMVWLGAMVRFRSALRSWRVDHIFLQFGGDAGLDFLGRSLCPEPRGGSQS